MAFLIKHPNSRFWVAGFYDANGKRKRRSTKIEATEKNRRRAQRIADEYENAAKQVRTARHVRKVITELHKELSGSDVPTATVRGFFDVWVARKTNEVKPTTLAFYKGKIRSLLKFLGPRADRDISEISRSDLINFRDEMAKCVSSKTANHGIKAIKAFFRDAATEGFIPENPADGIRSVRMKDSELSQVRPFTLEELSAVYNAANDEWKSMILFGVYTMLRLGDIARLTSNNIDWNRKSLLVHVAKTGRNQEIPLASQIWSHIEEQKSRLKNPDEPIHSKAFESITRTGRPQTLSRQFASLLAEVGLREPVSHKKEKKGRDQRRQRSPLSFHSLRHTGNSLLANAGVDRELRKSITGHTSNDVHADYTHLEMEIRRKALNRLPRLENSE